MAAACMMAMSLASCEESAVDEIGGNADAPLELTAMMDGLVQSRANGDTSDGAVQFGTYYFTYPQGSSKNLTYLTSPCIFTESVGRIYPTSSPLEWKDLPSLSTYSFKLDNLSETATQIDAEGTMLGVTLDGERASKYGAALEGVNNNDIVWGALDGVTYSANNIHFDMTHRMSRVSVTVQGEQEALKGNVTVRLKDVVTEAALFNRMDGSIILPDECTYEDIVLVDNAPLTPVANSVNTYTTPNLILPPQSLRSGTDRPRLEITIGEDLNQKTYTGALPSGMIYETAGYAATLEFCQGVHLELRVSRLAENLEEPEILFLPAVVRNWEDKGEYLVNSNQQGVYSTQDLVNAIKAYNAKDVNEMKKYGYLLYKTVDDFYNEDVLPSYFYINLHANIEMPDESLPENERKFHTSVIEPEIKVKINYFNGFKIGDYGTWDEIKEYISY